MKLLNMFYGASLSVLLLAAACTAQPTTVIEQATVPPATIPATQTSAAPLPILTATTTAVSQPSIENTRTTLRLTPIPTLQLELVPTLPATAAAGEVPEEILTAVYADLIKSQNTAREEIILVKAEAAIWNDGALGCPQPGQVYTQAIVNGYLIVLEVVGHTYSYHATETGYFILCQNNLAPSPPVVGTPIS